MLLLREISWRRAQQPRPLQCSCLENPRDRGPWRAAVQGGCKDSDTTERLNYSNKSKCMQRICAREIVASSVSFMLRKMALLHR